MRVLLLPYDDTAIRDRSDWCDMNPLVSIEALAARVRAHGLILPAHIFVPIMLRGTDAIDLIHRLSTNDLRGIKPGDCIGTVFTNEKGRFIDQVEVIQTREGACLVSHASAAEQVRAWVNKYIISEDVSVIDVSSSHNIVSVLTDDEHSLAARTTGSIPNAALSCVEFPHQWSRAFGPFTVNRYLIGNADVSGCMAALRSVGAEEMDEIGYREMRVAAGIPSHPAELNESHNPLESGLRADVSFTKGCYIGQEVIARLDSYDKVQRELVVLSVSAERESVSPEAIIEATDGPVGTVTSVGGKVGATGEIIVMGYVRVGTPREEGLLLVRTEDGPRSARIQDPSRAPWWSGSTPA